MTAKKGPQFADIEKAIKGMLAEADTFDERRQSVETAMKFEALKLKAKGRDFGKGFDDDQGGDGDGDF